MSDRRDDENTLHPLLWCSGFRITEDLTRPTVIMLHDSGLWVEIDDHFFDEMTKFEAQVISNALQSAVESGIVGRSLIEMTREGINNGIQRITAKVIPT